MNESNDASRTLDEFLSVLRNPYGLSGDELRDTRHEAANRIEALITDNVRLREALKWLYDETVDYIQLNHLGDAHSNSSMKQARAALAGKG